MTIFKRVVQVMSITGIVSVVLVFFFPTCRGQNLASPASLTPHPLPATELYEALTFVRGVTALGLSTSYAVEGDKYYAGQVLAADTINFAPGSRLILTGTKGPRYIIARTIILPPQGRVTLSWALDPSDSAGTSVATTPPQDFKASSGSIGGGDGAGGTAGSDGHSGNPGYPGLDAPTVYLFAGDIEGSPLIVELQGKDGGSGGTGQDGGDGGPGRSGSQGLSSVFDCKAGGGNGGNGGQGGTGGKGGPGGRGGNGGTFVVFSSSATLSKALAEGAPVIKVQATGGKGGQGGLGGNGGAGGPPGGGGPGSGLCHGGAPGVPGPPGKPGPVGDSGRDGVIGSFWITTLTNEQVKNLGIRR